MRVLMLTIAGFGFAGSGEAKFSRDFMTALSSHPALSEIVAIPRWMNVEEPLPNNVTNVKSGLNGKLRYVRAAANLVRHDPEFDLIFCGHVNLLPVAFLLRRWVRSSPIVLITHGVDAWEPTNRPLVNYLAKRVDCFISVSELTGQRFCSWTKLDRSKNLVLPNTIDLERYSPGPKSAVLCNKYGLGGKTVLMTLGRLWSSQRYKGIDEVLELLPALAQDIPNIAYVVAGEGSDRRRLEEKAKRLGVEERAVFTGFVPEEEKVAHYRLADAYVMPGWGEGFGIVYLEAMACGVPVVASKADGSREAVRDGALGILVDPADSEDVRKGILEALSRPRGVVPRGIDYFSYENFERRLHSILDKSIAKASQRPLIRG